eukprot:390743-Amphidinium_carterae.1
MHWKGCHSACVCVASPADIGNGLDWRCRVTLQLRTRLQKTRSSAAFPHRESQPPLLGFMGRLLAEQWGVCNILCVTDHVQLWCEAPWPMHSKTCQSCCKRYLT